jgi:hypothetical protein
MHFETEQALGARGHSTEPPFTERRRKRSHDPITALHYQLAFTRSAAGLDAVVLVDESGCLVAGAGAWPTCEELAAYAPLFARPDQIGSATVSSRIRALSSEVSVHAVSLACGEAFLCGRGTGGQADVLARAAEGCRRILAAD